MPASRLPVLIAGAGIGGLACALALQRAGFRVRVFEQAKTLGEAGAGLTLASNGTVVLEHLGLSRLVREVADRPRAGAVVHYRSGAMLVEIPRGSAQTERFGAPYCQVHRADLHAALLDAVRGRDSDCVHSGAAVSGISERGDRVTVKLADGAAADGSLLVGADGIHSVVRAALYGDESPEFAGFAAYRGLVPAARLPGGMGGPDSAVWIGPGRYITRYRIRQGSIVNYVGVTRTDKWTEEGWSVRATRDEALAIYGEFEPRARALIEWTPDDALYRWGIFERAPLECWSSGRVTLLGDAAHPMSPFLGQGAVMAIEDAMILSRCLSLETSVGDALDRYQRLRIPRTRFVAAESHRNGVRLSGMDPDHYDGTRHRDEETLHIADYNAVTAPLDP